MAGRDTDTYRARVHSRKRSRRRETIIRSFVIVLALVVVGFSGYSIFASGIFSQSNSGNGAVSDVDAINSPSNDEKEDAGSIVIGVNGSENTILLKGEEYLEAGAHAANESGVLTGKIQTSGTVDSSKPGDYEITYSVTDEGGYIAKATRTVTVKESFEKMNTGVPVLMYHYVYTANDVPEDLNSNWILDTALDEQLKYLTDNGYYFPSFQEVRAFVGGKHTLPAKSVVLTFDDAMPQFLTYGIPVLEKYKVPATSFVICSDGDALQKIIGFRNKYIMYDSHSFDLHRGGGSIGHGGRISALSETEIEADLKTSADMLQVHNAFAYPFGDVTEDGKVAVEISGYQCGFTTKNDWCYIGDDVRALNRVRIQGNISLSSYASLVSE